MATASSTAPASPQGALSSPEAGGSPQGYQPGDMGWPDAQPWAAPQDRPVLYRRETAPVPSGDALWKLPRPAVATAMAVAVDMMAMRGWVPTMLLGEALPVAGAPAQEVWAAAAERLQGWLPSAWTGLDAGQDGVVAEFVAPLWDPAPADTGPASGSGSGSGGSEDGGGAGSAESPVFAATGDGRGLPEDAALRVARGEGLTPAAREALPWLGGAQPPPVHAVGVAPGTRAWLVHIADAELRKDRARGIAHCMVQEGVTHGVWVTKESLTSHHATRALAELTEVTVEGWGLGELQAPFWRHVEVPLHVPLTPAQAAAVCTHLRVPPPADVPRTGALPCLRAGEDRMVRALGLPSGTLAVLHENLDVGYGGLHYRMVY